MNPCKLSALVSSLSCIIAKDKSKEEIALLSSIFNQLGDSLATILAAEAHNEKCN